MAAKKIWECGDIPETAQGKILDAVEGWVNENVHQALDDFVSEATLTLSTGMDGKLVLLIGDHHEIVFDLYEAITRYVDASDFDPEEVDPVRKMRDGLAKLLANIDRKLSR